MNAHEAAVTKRLRITISDEIARHSEILVNGGANDMVDYRSRVARVNAYREVLTMLTDIERELKS